MLKVSLGICRRGSSEQEYTLTMMMPELPRAGDRISVFRSMLDAGSDDDIGVEDFIVRRTWWSCHIADKGRTQYAAGEEPVGTVGSIWIECEMAIGGLSSKHHRRNAGPDAVSMFSAERD